MDGCNSRVPDGRVGELATSRQISEEGKVDRMLFDHAAVIDLDAFCGHEREVVVLGVVGCAEEKEALFAGARYVD